MGNKSSTSGGLSKSDKGHLNSAKKNEKVSSSAKKPELMTQSSTISLDGDKKKQKKEKKKSFKKDRLEIAASQPELSPSQRKQNGVAGQHVGQNTATLFRSGDAMPKQLSQVILPDRDLDIKVYKKSRENLNDTFDGRSRRYRSLPRSKSTGLRNSTDTLLSCESRVRSGQNFRQQRYNSFNAAAAASASYNSRWSSVVGSDSPPSSGGKPIRLKGITFPSEDVIHRHTTLFERTFVEHFVGEYYSSLPEVVQLSAVIIAYRRTYDQGKPAYQPINLRQYLQSETEEDVPGDLTSFEARKWYIPAVPEGMLTGLVHLRSKSVAAKEEGQIKVCADLVRCIALEAARELSRIYEYQLSVVSDLTSVQILGKYAAERSAEYLRSGNRFVERDSLVEGTAYTSLPCQLNRLSVGSCGSSGSGYVSAIFGTERELRWEVSHVFGSCGLRLDSPEKKGSQSGPVFLTSRDSLPLVYGYRSPICKRDLETSTDNISQVELTLFSEVLQDNPDDFHRDYIPLRLVYSNHSSLLDSQSVSSLYHQQGEAKKLQEGRNGRYIRESTSMMINGNANRDGGSRPASRASNLNSNYGSMARSMEFERMSAHRPMPSSKSFQRESPAYQSERAPAVGGRLSKYSHFRPERITNQVDSNLTNGTLRKISNTNQPVSYNQQTGTMKINNTNQPVSYYQQTGTMNGRASALGGQATGRVNGTYFPNYDVKNHSHYITTANNRQTVPTGQLVGSIHDNQSTLTRPPPRPPVRTVSSSQYNHHPNVHPSRTPLQDISQLPTVPSTISSIRLPHALETSFDCDQPTPIIRVTGCQSNGIERNDENQTDIGFDFQSFLKMVESQNANLRAFDSKTSTTTAVATKQSNANGSSRIET